MKAVKEKENIEMRNIVLFCAAGMSTSILVTKMKEYVDKIGYTCEINAHALTETSKYGEDADIILLGPQVRFQLNNVKKQLPNKIVEPIDMQAYGTMDGKKVIEFVKEKLGD